MKRKNIKKVMRNCLYVAIVSVTVAGSLLSSSFADEINLAGFPNAVIKQPNAEYVENSIDLQVKVLGGDVTLNRTWANGRWYINPSWESLRFIKDPLGSIVGSNRANTLATPDAAIQSIDRAGAIYKRTGDAGVYQFDQYTIQKLEFGWRWYDQQGNWIIYDSNGDIVQYGDRNDVSVNFVRDTAGRLTHINDHHGQLVYQFAYDSKDRIISVKDRADRVVQYGWNSDNHLVKVTDVLGTEWGYGYNNDGQISHRYEPDGGIIQIIYDVTVPAGKPSMIFGSSRSSQRSGLAVLGSKQRDFKPARVGKIINKTGAITLVNTQYDAAKKTYLITITDPMGKKTETLSNSKGQMLSQTVNGILQEKVSYEGKYRRAYTDARGLTATIDLSATERPVKIMHADGTSESYEYSAQFDQLTRSVNAKGIVTTFNYDMKGNLTSSIEAVGTPMERQVNYQYDQYGQLTEISLGKGDHYRSFIQEYDVNGNTVGLIDSKGNPYTFTFNEQGKVTSAINPLDAKWQYEYNPAGGLTKVINPLNHEESYEFDSIGRVAAYTDPLGFKTDLSFTFNNTGTQRSVTNTLGYQYREEYNLAGQLIQSTSPSGLVEKQTYNLEGRLDSVIDPMGNVISLEYDKTGAQAGLLSKVNYPTFSENYRYNAKGRITAITQWLSDTESQTTVNSYDELGQLVAEALPGNRTTQMTYDELGNLIQQTDAMGSITTQKWNVLGELVEVTNANGQSHQFAYDANSNLIEEVNPSSGTTTYEYDQANQLIKSINAKGDITTYQYDLAGNLITEIVTAKDVATPSQTITYRYNDAGQLLEVTQTGDTDSHHVYTLDAMGRTTLEKVTYGKGATAITKQLEYGYDEESRLASFKYPEGSLVNYQYDKTLLKQTALANGQSIEWSKYQWFSPTEINFPNVKQTRSYDALQQPLEINVANSQNSQNNSLINRVYQYNPAGNIIERGTEQGKVNYRYDLLDRLTEATPEKALQNLGLPDEAYTYDAIGNRLGSRHQQGQFEYNQQDQLIKWGANAQLEALSYTLTGQVKQKKKLTETIDYSYDATDRLSQVKRDDTEIASYQYDPFGRRFSKHVNGETTYYLYSDEGLIAELNEQGKVDVAYGWEPNSMWGTSPLWQANLTTGQTLQNAAYHYLHTDHIGTPQIATNKTGEITWQAVAEAFGETKLNPANQITMNLRFPGQYYDAETGTHYNYFRDYDPRVGRYQQSDPIGLGGGINFYGYVEGNSILLADPYGLETCILVTYNLWSFGAFTGTHAAVYGTNSSRGKWLYDPNGSYHGQLYYKTTNSSFITRVGIVTEAGVKKGFHRDFSIKDYIQFHETKDGDHTKSMCVETTIEQEDLLIKKSEEYGNAGSFSCAENVTSAIKDSEIFPGFKYRMLPRKIAFPEGTKVKTDIHFGKEREAFRKAFNQAVLYN